MKRSSVQKIILFAITISSFYFTSCSGRRAVFLESQEIPKSNEVVTEVKLNIRAAADSLWELRGTPEKALEMLKAYVTASETNPTDINLLARLSRAYYLVGNYVESDPDKKDELFTKGLETGERALGLIPSFRKSYTENEDVKIAIKEVGIEGIEAIYWTGANYGKWAAEKNLLVRLGNKSKIEAYNQRVFDLDRNFFYGAADRFFGALPTRVPGGDLNLSKFHFEKSIELAPNYFGTRTLFAEYYATKAQDKDTFVKQLEYVINTPYDLVPEIIPENKYEQEYAKKLLERIDEFFK
ncbi:MAG: hypothetical protein CVV24_02795 [Ignavibacteriae bacterium HGW-Ignavibacteriae-3]|nr:MAG: hypothetical protein CVV24_02795 [Ignavibacteriae bacterium HGW-Ignavibacteriae-3]